jgi:DNA-binding CsgD family transcriptional regulator
MTDFSKNDLKRKIEEAKKEVEYYKKITEQTGKLCLRETEALSKLLRWRKQAEEALIEREVELEKRNTRLKEVNAALKILLEKRIQDKAEFEENVLTNVKELVLPYVEKIKKAGLSDKQEVFADILEANLKDIVSPFAHKLSHKYLNFTPTELKVANLVKEGLRTKEIADLLNSSPETISGHRKSMRKKLKLTDKKSNLRTHLLSLSDGYI